MNEFWFMWSWRLRERRMKDRLIAFLFCNKTVPDFWPLGTQFMCQPQDWDCVEDKWLLTFDLQVESCTVVGLPTSLPKIRKRMISVWPSSLGIGHPWSSCLHVKQLRTLFLMIYLCVAVFLLFNFIVLLMFIFQFFFSPTSVISPSLHAFWNNSIFLFGFSHCIYTIISALCFLFSSVLTLFISSFAGSSSIPRFLVFKVTLWYFHSAVLICCHSMPLIHMLLC